MDKNQYEELNSINSEEKTISVKDLTERRERTLLYGHLSTRETFHVYLRNGLLHKAIFSQNDHEARIYESGESLSLNGIVPDKRLFPEACDFDFCSLLVKAGISLPFTTWDESREDKVFHTNVVQTGKKLSAWISKK